MRVITTKVRGWVPYDEPPEKTLKMGDVEENKLVKMVEDCLFSNETDCLTDTNCTKAKEIEIVVTVNVQEVKKLSNGKMERPEPWPDSPPEKETKELDSSTAGEMEPTKINFGRCIFCGKEGSDATLCPGISCHLSCVSCPQCGENEMIIWKKTKPYVARCLMCLHKWTLLKEQETT